MNGSTTIRVLVPKGGERFPVGHLADAAGEDAGALLAHVLNSRQATAIAPELGGLRRLA